MRLLGFFWAFFFVLGTLASAQEKPRAVLVLDGSGSMWGQIGGVAKITIAQDVIGEFLEQLPADQELGLMAYGHNRRGDCGDIETLVEPGLGSRAEIREAVNGISPKGKTPLSEAVRQAAQALRFTEEPATVILVSDGRETCDVDPCALGRELEELGIGITAHVIGFDITEPEDVAQLQCLASETGGTYRTAADGAELAEAMTVVMAPAPEPEPLRVTFSATNGEGGARITDLLVWEVENVVASAVVGSQEAATLALDLLPGRYRVNVLRPADTASGSLEFTLTEQGRDIVVALPLARPQAALEFAPEVEAGSSPPVAWTGPAGDTDQIQVRDPATGERLTYAATVWGNPVNLPMPSKPGVYDVVYVWMKGRQVITTASITVYPATAKLAPPASAEAGATLALPWVGPGNSGDQIQVRPVGSAERLTYAATAWGNPVNLPLPAEPGNYEIVYVLRQDSAVIATAPIRLTPAGAQINAPATAEAGSNLQLPWVGPGNGGDQLQVRPVGGDERLTYAVTDWGNPSKLAMPSEPGDYEIVYVLRQDNVVIARVPITLTAPSARIDAPATAEAGSNLQLPWVGPGNGGDQLQVRPVGGDERLTYAVTDWGNPSKLAMPSEPGDYEIVYVLRQDNVVITAQRITLTAASASVDLPAELPMGEKVEVAWDGPGNGGDLIEILPVGSDKRISYAVTDWGNPARIDLPDAPGAYRLVYRLKNGKKIITEVPFTLQ
ncbi:MAG: VWA domain-containing protein [Pseudomonadota bacterium]